MLQRHRQTPLPRAQKGSTPYQPNPAQQEVAKRNLVIQIMDATGLPRQGAQILLASLAQLEKQQPNLGIQKLDPDQLVQFIKQLMPKIQDHQNAQKAIQGPLQDQQNLQQLLNNG